MHTLELPKTDLIVSSLCLGTAQFGLKVDDHDSHALLDQFCESGGNLLDTARVYSNWAPGERSRSERVIGDWLALRKNRGSIVLGTKGGHPELATMHLSRLSPEELELDLNGSLATLRTEYIDIYWLHRDDPARPAGEIIETLNKFVRAGKVRYFACSNWTALRIREANEYAARQGLNTFIATQVLWNIGMFHMIPPRDPTITLFDKELYRIHAQTGIAAIPFSSQANGFFSLLDIGDAGCAERIRTSDYNTAGNGTVYRVMKEIAERYSLSITEAVLSYLLSQPIVVIPTIGASSAQQLSDSLGASTAPRLPLEALNALEVVVQSGFYG